MSITTKFETLYKLKKDGKNDWKAKVKEENIESGCSTRWGKKLNLAQKTIIMTVIPHERLHPH